MNTFVSNPPGDLSAQSLDFASLQKQYAKGLSPTALIEEVYRRLDADKDANIWIHIAPREQALQEARRIEQLAASGQSLPLYGLPFGVKDNIDVAGLPTTAACASLNHIADSSATVVEKLRAAGAILIGKQNMDQFATGLVGIRSPAGYCRNPFDQRYIPGGSSSGSAVAVSVGHVSFSIGSDTGGSGRVPAAFNNIVGLKPTPGLVSTHGFLYNNRSFDVAPILALTTLDAFQVLVVLAGHDERDPFCVAVPLGQDDSGDMSDRFSFGIPAKRHLQFFGDAFAEAQFNAAVEQLLQLGGVPVEIDFSPFLEANELVFNSAFIAERWITYGAIAENHPEDVHPAVLHALQAGQRYTAVDAFNALYRLEQLKQQAYRILDAVKLLVTPTAGTIYRCDEVEADPLRLNSNLGYYTYFANLLRLSAISVPAGFRPDGLPFGICLIAAPFDDERLLYVANRFHHAIGGRLGATRHHLAEQDQP